MSEVHSSAGSYAVDAMSPSERYEFEDHLAGCVSCRREVAEFAETLAKITPLAAVAPPPALRNSILAAVASSSQWGPQLVTRTDEDAVEAADDGSDVNPRRALPPQVVALRPHGSDDVAPLEEHPSVLPDTPWLDVTAQLRADTPPDLVEPPIVDRRRERLFKALLAASAAMIIGLSVWLYNALEQREALVAQGRQEVAVLSAADAKVYHGAVENGGPVSFVVSRERNEALFIAPGLTAPGQGKTYQLWVVNEDGAKSAGLVPEGGDVRQLITKPLTSVDVLAVSLENAGGSSQPTTVLAEVKIPA